MLKKGFLFPHKGKNSLEETLNPQPFAQEARPFGVISFVPYRDSVRIVSWENDLSGFALYCPQDSCSTGLIPVC